jgi:predicted HAD superfamily Cof-like phosphohydrolase
MRSDFNDVGDFHRKFGLPTTDDGPPRELTAEEMRFRVRFLLEELEEYCEALGISLIWKVSAPPVTGELSKQDLPHAFDALMDLVYVALGTAQMHRFPWAEGWLAVQTANMTKERAQNDGSDSKRGSSLDVVKPEGWQPPTQNIIEAMMQAGWLGPELPLGSGE